MELHHRSLFENFKRDYNKLYAVEEEELRFDIFLRNLELVEERNASEGPNGATHGVTKFMDLS